MGKIVKKQQYSFSPNSSGAKYPPPSVSHPTTAEIQELLRGYDAPDTVLPNAVLFTNSDSKIASLSVIGNLSLNGAPEADTAINTLGKTNTIDCGEYD